MEHVLSIRPLTLPARAVHRVENGKGLQITAISGGLWVTQANDARDIVLGRGQSFIIDRDGLTVIYALKESALLIGPPGHVTAADFDVLRARPHAA